jgi:hypothetical protein
MGVRYVGSGERSKQIQKLRRSLNGAELDEGLLNLHLLVVILMILKKHFLALMKHIHFLFVVLADGDKPLNSLKNPDLPEEG